MNWRHALRRKFTHRRYSTTKTNFRCVNVSGFQSGTCLGQLVDQTSMFFSTSTGFGKPCFCDFFLLLILKVIASFGLLNSQHVHLRIFFFFVDTIGECTTLLQACAFCRGHWWLLLLSGRGGSRGEAETERDRQL